MVHALLCSGKRTIGAGAGNPPVVVDDTADLSLAARELYRGASFDNNLLCLAEKEVFVMDNVAEELVDRLVGEGAVGLLRNVWNGQWIRRQETGIQHLYFQKMWSI